MPEHTPAPTPSRAVYGFVMFLSFKIFFLIYLVWAVVPEKYFEQIGIDFLPQRDWAVLVPIYILTALWMFAFVIYPSLGAMMTPHIDSMRTITDKIGSRRKDNGKKLDIEDRDEQCACRNPGDCYKNSYDLDKAVEETKKIPVLCDLKIWDVCENLYLDQ